MVVMIKRPFFSLTLTTLLLLNLLSTRSLFAATNPAAYLPIIKAHYPFTKTAVSPAYLQNFANNAGCHWLGIAGGLQDANGKPTGVGDYQVHVWGSGIDERVPIGSAPAYGPASWEQFLFSSPVVRSYWVQLEWVDRTAVSAIYPIITRASCDENLVWFDFQANQP
ncbi:MAG: hypothetical protein H6668_14465 [Ardenticatenaceae bacterium]|nr:hypothetical protein [Ardenticatenaceae bacterium]